jgi:microcompartment protein CcmL/EutN
MSPEPEALALIEFGSIAAGTRAVDALVKKAPVKIERVGTLQPGKLAVLFSGDPASVDASYAEALSVAEDSVDDRVLLPHVEPSVYRAALGELGDFGEHGGDTLGVVETETMAAIVAASDAAVKGASVRVVSLRMGDELGGKGLAHLLGAQHDVEAALELARATAAGRGLTTSMTPRLDDDLRRWLARSTRFWGGG